MPQRIQRSRAKGWRMPPNTRYCGRGTKYGNPFPVAQHGRPAAIALFRAHLEAMPAAQRDALVAELLAYDYAACWCALDVECHVDVWLEHAAKVR